MQFHSWIVTGKEINASLSFQIVIYFNVWFYPVWAIGLLVTVRHKVNSCAKTR